MDRSLSCRKLLVSSGLSSSLANWDQLPVLSSLLLGGLGDSSGGLASFKTSASDSSLFLRLSLWTSRHYYQERRCGMEQFSELTLGSREPTSPHTRHDVGPSGILLLAAAPFEAGSHLFFSKLNSTGFLVSSTYHCLLDLFVFKVG